LGLAFELLEQQPHHHQKQVLVLEKKQGQVPRRGARH
jgi:hypothetical protein